MKYKGVANLEVKGVTGKLGKYDCSRTVYAGYTNPKTRDMGGLCKYREELTYIIIKSKLLIKREDL